EGSGQGQAETVRAIRSLRRHKLLSDDRQRGGRLSRRACRRLETLRTNRPLLNSRSERLGINRRTRSPAKLLIDSPKMTKRRRSSEVIIDAIARSFADPLLPE